MADRYPTPRESASAPAIEPVLHGRWWWDGANWRFWDGTKWTVLGDELPSFVRVPRTLWWTFLSAAIVCAFGWFLAGVIFVIQVAAEPTFDENDTTGLAAFIISSAFFCLMLIFGVLAAVFRVRFSWLRPPQLLPHVGGASRTSLTATAVQLQPEAGSVAATSVDGSAHHVAPVDNSIGAAGHSVPADWYPSPNEPGFVRYWDGSNWTPHKEVAAYGPDPRTQESRIMACLAHLSAFIVPLLVPLVIRFTRGKSDAFVRHNASEAANFQLMYLVVWNVLFFGVLSPLAMSGSEAPPWFFAVFFSMFGLGIACFGLTIYAGYASYQGRWWRYPVNVRLIPGSNKAAAKAKEVLKYQPAEGTPEALDDTPASNLASHLRLGKKYGKIVVALQAVEVVLIPAFLLTLAVLFGGFTQPPGQADNFGYVQILFVGFGVITGATLIATMLWLYQASLAAQALGYRARWSPVWVFLSFIVPVADLFVPYQIASDCLPAGSRSRRSVAVWWGLRLTSAIAVVAGTIASAFATTAGVISAAIIFGLLAGLLLATMRAVTAIGMSQAAAVHSESRENSKSD